MRKSSLMVLSLALTLGCQAIAPTSKAKPPRTASPIPLAAGSPAVTPVAVGDPVKTAAATEPPRAVTAGVPVTLVGQVKLISDKGFGIISNNTGNVVSNNGSNLIGNNSGNVVSNQGAALRVLAGEPQRQALLADALIEVLDAQGRLLVDAAGKPLSTVSDSQGAYSFKTALPVENLILRIRLFPDKPGSGELRAMLAKDARTGQPTIDLDTASSLGTAYVLAKYVQGNQTVFDRLPATEASALYREVEAARSLLPATPDYRSETLVTAVETLRGQVPALSTKLEQIKALLLVGQANNGNGRQATDVPLVLPMMAFRDAAGALLIAEFIGRIRKVAPDGVISSYAGEPGLAGDLAQPLLVVSAIIPAPDGGLYLAERLAARIHKLSAAGKLTLIAGNGTTGLGGVGGPATAGQLTDPMGLALATDGSLYFGEVPRGAGVRGRIMRIDPAGILSEIPCPEPEWTKARVPGVAVAPDGTLYAIQSDADFFCRKKPGAAWEFLRDDMKFTPASRLWIGPKGEVYISESSRGNLHVFNPDGTFTHLAGRDQAGFAGDGGPALSAEFADPSGLWLSPDNVLYVADSGNGKVRTIDMNDPSHPVKTIAGVQGLTQVGDALAIAINGPGGLALDAQGRLVMSESGSGTIKRLVDRSLTTIAGTSTGDSGDGGPALSAQFSTPGGIAFDGEVLYLADSKNRRIRKVDFAAPGAPTSTIVGTGKFGVIGQQLADAASLKLHSPTALAVAPDHRLAFTDAGNQMVLYLRADGQVELLAGDPNGTQGDGGDGGPGRLAKCSNPLGVAFDAAGDLYIADTGNLRVRKVDMKDPERRITTFAGLSRDKVTAQLLAGNTFNDEGKAAKDSVFWAPCALAFDAAGDLFVAELGTVNLGALAGADAIPTDFLPKVGARIRKIDMKNPLHPITTIAGAGAPLLGDVAGDNTLRIPLAMVFDAKGQLVIADSGLNQLKVLPKGSF